MDIRYTNDNYQFLLRVSTLIFNEDESKVLLFNVAGRSFYMLPGGKINELEESIDAIKRESLLFLDLYGRTGSWMICNETFLGKIAITS